MADAAMSDEREAAPARALISHELREERDLAAIKREMRRAKRIYFYTDFDVAICLSRQKAFEIVRQATRPIYANITANSVFIHASEEK